MSYKQLIGAHISASGGVQNAASRAQKQGCEIMQIFVQSPRTFKTPITTLEEVRLFKASLKEYNIKQVYVHAPYLVNLASPNARLRYGSASMIRCNLDRASKLGCKYLMTHIGSYGTGNREKGLERVIKSISKLLDGYTGKCELLLELSAGSGNIIGSRFEEIGRITKTIKPLKIGVCLDTAHIFASGYDISSKVKIDTVLRKFDKKIGLNKLKLIHLNDSKAELNSKKDRHANIGDGFIPTACFKYLIKHLKLKKINFILETPGTWQRRKKDIELLKSLPYFQPG